MGFENSGKRKRNANIELIRIISMLMIISVHAMYKGDILLSLDNPTATVVSSWILECIGVNGLNLFMLITGYLMVKSDFKIGRLLEIIAQVMFYSVSVWLVLVAFGKHYSTYEVLRVIFPIHNNVYWFCTAYVLLYLLSPVLRVGVQHMTKAQLGAGIMLLLIFECAFKTLLPVRLTEDEMGYDLIWFLVMFLIAAYIRLYGISFLEKPLKAYVIHLICVVMMFLWQFIIVTVNARTGRLEDLIGVSLEHNHIFLLLSSVSLFMAIINAPCIEGVWAKIICFFAPFSFGVYLLHEHGLIRYEWPHWIGLERLSGAPWYLFVPVVIGVSVLVYLTGSVVDYLRGFIFSGVKKMFNASKLTALLKKLDGDVKGVQ